MLGLGDRLGDFQIRRLLGRGGMGEVYEAYEPALNRCVALKLLPEWLSEEPGALERFQQEAATAARLEHPQIVPIYAWGQADNRFFFTMKLIQGLPLSAFIQRRLMRERLPLCTTQDGQENLSTPLATGLTSDFQGDTTVANVQAAGDAAFRDAVAGDDDGSDDAAGSDEAADGSELTQTPAGPPVPPPRQAYAAQQKGHLLAELNEVFE